MRSNPSHLEGDDDVFDDMHEQNDILIEKRFQIKAQGVWKNQLNDSNEIEEEEKFKTQSIAMTISPSEGGLSRYESGFNFSKSKIQLSDE